MIVGSLNPMLSVLAPDIISPLHIVIFKIEQLFDTFLQRLLGGGELFEIGLGHVAQGDKGRDFRGKPVAGVMLLSGLSVPGQFQALVASPTPRMRGDGSVLEVERDMAVVGFDGEGFGNGPGRCGVGVPIE